MRILQLRTVLLDMSDFQIFFIWWAVHLVLVGVNVSIDNKIVAEFTLSFGGWATQRADYLVALQ